jgi:hypothetical protein
MAWHLNLDHGFYRIKVPISEPEVQTSFGVKDGEKIVELGPLHLDLQELLSQDLIEKESSTHYRVQIFFDKPKFFIGKGRKTKLKRYLDFKFSI